jgi:large conductance mechanosensitive channel
VLKGFKDFITRGNVVDMAVGVVVGTAFGGVVSALVRDIFSPLIGVFGGPDMKGFIVDIGGAKFLFGDFIASVINFLIISAVIYFGVVMPMGRLMPKESVTEKNCPECLSSIPLKAKKCKWCGSKV